MAVIPRDWYDNYLSGARSEEMPRVVATNLAGTSSTMLTQAQLEAARRQATSGIPQYVSRFNDLLRESTIRHMMEEYAPSKPNVVDDFNI